MSDFKNDALSAAVRAEAISIEQAKVAAGRLKTRLAELGVPIKHTQALEGAAAVLSGEDWNRFSAKRPQEGVDIGTNRCNLEGKLSTDDLLAVIAEEVHYSGRSDAKPWVLSRKHAAARWAQAVLPLAIGLDALGIDVARGAIIDLGQFMPAIGKLNDGYPGLSATLQGLKLWMGDNIPGHRFGWEQGELTPCSVRSFQQWSIRACAGLGIEYEEWARETNLPAEYEHVVPQPAPRF